MNAADFQASMAALPPMVEEPPEFTWDHHRWALRRHVTTDKATNFLTWPTVVATMFVGEAPYIQRERSFLSNPRWMRAAHDPGFGNPEIIPKYNTSGNYIHQAYHLYRWELSTGLLVNNLRKITEFGGGYGALCVIARALGFTGEYVIYDLPEFSLLQQYYLSNLAVQFTPQIVLPFVHQYNQKECRYVFEPPADAGAGNDLLVGCYSLSEVRKDLREDFSDQVDAENILIVHQDVYADNDLCLHFTDFMDRRKGYDWLTMPTGSLDGHWYILGKKKERTND